METATNEASVPRKYLFIQGYICEIEQILDRESFSKIVESAKTGDKKAEESIRQLLSDTDKMVFSGAVYEIINLYPGQRFTETIIERLTSQFTADAQSALPACKVLTSVDPRLLAKLLNEEIGFKIISSRLYAIKRVFKAEAFCLGVEIGERTLENVVLLDHQGKIAKIISSKSLSFRGNFEQKLKARFDEGEKALEILSWEDQEQILAYLLQKAEETSDASQQILFLESALKLAKGKLKEVIQAKLGRVFANFFRKTVITQRMSLFNLFYEQGLELLGEDFKTLTIDALLEEAEKTPAQNLWRKISLYEGALQIIKEIDSEKIELIEQKLQNTYLQQLETTIRQKPEDTLRIVIQITTPYLNVGGKEEELSQYLVSGASKIYKKDPDKALEFLIRARQEHSITPNIEKKLEITLNEAYSEKAAQLLAKGNIKGLISTAEKAMQVTGSEKILYDVVKTIQNLKPLIIYENRERLYNILTLAQSSKEKLREEIDETLLKAAILLRKAGELTTSVQFIGELLQAKPNDARIMKQAAITYKASCSEELMAGQVPKTLELVNLGLKTLPPYKEELFTYFLIKLETCPLSIIKDEKDSILEFGKKQDLTVRKPLAETLVSMTLSNTEESAETIILILKMAQTLSPNLKDKPVLTDLLKQITQNYAIKGLFTQSHKTIESAQVILKDPVFQSRVKEDLKEIINNLPSIEVINDLIGLQELLLVLNLEYEYYKALFTRLLIDCASNAWTMGLTTLLDITEEMLNRNDQKALIQNHVLPRLQERAKDVDPTQSFILYVIAKKIAQKYRLEDLIDDYETKINQTLIKQNFFEAIDKGSKYLLQKKDKEGLWSAEGDPLFTTAWATLALRIAGTFDDQIIMSSQKLVNELDNEADSAIYISWLPFFLQIKPQFIEDNRIKQILTKILSPSGAVPTAHIYSTGLLAWSLKKPTRQLKQLKEQMQKYLASNQSPQGFWAYGDPKENNSASTLGTSTAILGLHDSKKYQNHLKRGVAYLLSIQGANGAIHVNESSLITTTAYAILALSYAGSYEGNVLMKAINFLISKQNSDGGWGWVPKGRDKDPPISESKSNPNATAYVCFALSSFINTHFSAQR
ncbi:MAG: prenyltransferase/squalene oxidase repeat-containing protein [Candidatus Hermodarchaeota archaeon]